MAWKKQKYKATTNILKGKGSLRVRWKYLALNNT